MSSSDAIAISEAAVVEDPAFLRSQLITCIGNKRALLPFIDHAICQVKTYLGRERLRLADLFSGSGVVARLMKQHAETLLVNDLEAYSHAINRCYLANCREVPTTALNEAIAALQHAINEQVVEGFLTRLYAPSCDDAIQPGERVFYTRRNAMILDTACQFIVSRAADVRPFLLGPLLSEASVHANTAGVFKGFYKNGDGVGQFGGSGRDALNRITSEIRILPPILSRHDSKVCIHQGDALEMAGAMGEVDLVYLDPPYNQHPYGSNYFMLNLLVDYREPEEISRVSGIPRDWNRSVFNRRAESRDALLELVARVPARFVLISYNSEGFIDREDLIRGLSTHGRLEVRAIDYHAFRGSRNLAGRNLRVTEYLLLLDKDARPGRVDWQP